MLELSTPIQYVKGVGPFRGKILKKAGIQTAEDALYRLPYRYEDREHFKKISDVKADEEVTLLCTILDCHLQTTRRKGFTIFEVLVDDGTAALKALWFNQPYLKEVFRTGQRVLLHGAVKQSYRKGSTLQLENPEYEIADENEIPSIHMGRIVPIYSRITGLSVKLYRKILYNLVGELTEHIPEIIPQQISKRLGLIPKWRALKEVHFPPAGTSIDELNRFLSPAHQHLIFEEFFLLQAGLALRKRRYSPKGKGVAFSINDHIRQVLRKTLPFHLTPAQRKVLKEIVEDMRSPHAMNRLLQGDVGSGKTIVALLAILIAIENGYQAALMAPTEILTEQHYATIRSLLSHSSYHIALLSRGVKKEEREQIRKDIKEGRVNLVVGTHAIIQEGVDFHKLGLVVIDEQHRFGVMQRSKLIRKGEFPNVLIMTATPIPRSLALTFYGDLDISVIDQLPPGRKPITTVYKSEKSRKEVYNFIKKKISQGGQIYIVYPLVEPSEKIELKAASDMSARLKKNVFPNFRVALIHGRMKSEEKEEVMRAFTAGEINILVATTVIEEGVDVPTATVMVIEHADRFGLSQLHQLRGRIGRGDTKSYCILMADSPITPEARQRLQVIKQSNDGFYIAEKDLELRGPGEFFGTRQTGMPDLRVGNLVRDHHLLELARKEAFSYFDYLERTSRLSADPLIRFVQNNWEKRFGLKLVG
ncbi:ATP-dependent DNA helicase RecG [bacterium (candidate division B38) B3_B38]|nr:MAG: ATP-dependent DNA helicase RecG [bacterium (candidate division B38) B3_B38]